MKSNKSMLEKNYKSGWMWKEQYGTYDPESLTAPTDRALTLQEDCSQ